MDFNDIKSRIARVYAAIGEINIKKWEDKVNADWEEFNFTFGSQDEDENTNKILSLISALANLKDNLKNRVTAKGLDKQLVEQEIDNSLHLQLVADLDNQDKHGYPLTRNRRSKLDPRIVNVTSGIRINPDFNSDGMIIQLNWFNQTVQTAGGSFIIVNADITDSTGNIICSLEELVTQSITKWENFIAIHNLTV